MREGQGWRALPMTLLVGCMLYGFALGVDVYIRQQLEARQWQLAHWPLLFAAGCTLGGRVLFSHGMFSLASGHRGAVRRCLQVAGGAWAFLAVWGIARYGFAHDIELRFPWAFKLLYLAWWLPEAASVAALWFARRRAAAIAMLGLNGGLLLFTSVLWPRLPDVYALVKGFELAVSAATIALLHGVARPPLAEPERGRRGLRRVASGMGIGVIAAIQWGLTILVATSDSFRYHHRGVLELGLVASSAFAASSLVWCTWGVLDAARGLVHEHRRLSLAAGAMAWCATIAVVQAFTQYLTTYHHHEYVEFIHDSLLFVAPLVFIVGLFALLTSLLQLAHQQGELDIYLLLHRRRLSICLLALFAAVIGAWGIATGGLGNGAPGVFVVLMLACKIPAFGMAAHVIRSTADVLAPDVPAARIVGPGEA